MKNNLYVVLVVIYWIGKSLLYCIVMPIYHINRLAEWIWDTYDRVDNLIERLDER